MNPTRISRRRMIQCATAGGLTLSPFMSAVFGALKREASGEKPPLRFVFCVKSNGLWPEMIQPESLKGKLPYSYETEIVKTKHHPKGAINIPKDSMKGKRSDPFAAADEAHDGKFNEVMAPLTPFSDQVSVIQGIDTGFPILSGAHEGAYQALAATKARSKSEAVGRTLDSVFARAFPAPVPLLCMGHDSKSTSGLSYLRISAADPGKPNAFYTKPSRAYSDLFGVIDGGAAKAQYDIQSSILDFHVQDSKRLRSQIAAPEREQLDRYLNAFDSLRQSRAEIEAMADRLRKHAPEAPGEINIGNPIQIHAAEAKIAAASLISGLTNVVTFCFDRVSSTTYPEAGPLHASVGHGQGGVVLHKRQVITGSHIQQIAAMAAQLKAIPEAGGTMLDNTLFVYIAHNGRNHHSGEANFPIMLLGNLGGKLKQGRYYAPGNDPKDTKGESHVRVGDVWTTLLAAAGRSDDKIGIPRNGIAYKPIEALLA